MNLAERLQNRVSQLFGALHPAVPRGLGLGRVEGLAAERVGEFGESAAAIDRGLGPLGLQLVENAGQRGHLLLIQFQPVGQEPERPAHAEPSFKFVVTMTVAVAHEIASVPAAAAAVGPTDMMGMGVCMAGETPAPMTGSHRHLLLAGAKRARRGIVAWAKCLTRLYHSARDGWLSSPSK